MQASQQIQQSVCTNQRAKAAAYPTQVAQGMLWVWPETGPHAWLESAMTNPNLIPEMSDPSLAASDGSAAALCCCCSAQLVLSLSICMATLAGGLMIHQHRLNIDMNTWSVRSYALCSNLRRILACAIALRDC